MKERVQDTMQREKLKAILRDIDSLEDREYFEVLNAVLDLAQKRVQKQQTTYSLLDLQGRGKEIWQKINAQDYIDKERDSWKS